MRQHLDDLVEPECAHYLNATATCLHVPQHAVYQWTSYATRLVTWILPCVQCSTHQPVYVACVYVQYISISTYQSDVRAVHCISIIWTNPHAHTCLEYWLEYWSFKEYYGSLLSIVCKVNRPHIEQIWKLKCFEQKHTQGDGLYTSWRSVPTLLAVSYHGDT